MYRLKYKIIDKIIDIFSQYWSDYINIPRNIVKDMLNFYYIYFILLYRANRGMFSFQS